MPINLKSLAATLLSIAFVAMHGKAFAFQEEENLKQILQTKVPELKIETVSRSTIDGLFEIVANSRIFYSNPTGTHIIIGDIIDTTNQENSTETRFNSINSITIGNLPFQYAIKTKNGNGKRIIATFFDPNCSFCKKMSPEPDKVPNATIYIFLYPILSTDSATKSKMIFCADNPSLAWKQ
ncbi:DsbC family protein [Burkholderia sp. Ac-20353]|uniref:DsbC family protein n=1 Tax=Burkholderia sp. Ac-20353 TaxID=2703894 RepID=UPI00197B53F9|nr:DsbC family protein [Burkholderia sp. Ac-20353]MBN3788248.1 DsbC family protein [Burkholderia sp. Ac-20353]